MWTHEASIETSASPTAVWALFADVAGWQHWNAGIARIELHGAFATGTTFLMQTPGEEAFTSTLVAVEPPRGFTDETVVDGVRVLVQHRIDPLPAGGSRIVYRTQVDGPDAARFGAFVTGDFPDVLAALKQLAERSGTPAV
jgi:hypothetical protein